jgi:GH24 family phage-related lysozyme (muramidase)
MAYLNKHDRTSSPTKNDLFQPVGRLPALFGVFMGYVKQTTDVQRNGRIRIWVPELGSTPDDENGWITADYCSPFAGATNVETTSKANIQSFSGTQTSYGMWMIPPDINNIVIIMFINGDPNRAIWIGCLYNQFMNNMIPGMAGNKNNYQYPEKYIPVAEYNKEDGRITDPDKATKPYEETKFKGLGNQGLITDRNRGVTNTSARRESPSAVFGILTPGPVVDANVSPENVRRKGGSAFYMDDQLGSECVVLTTKSGAQVKLDETNGYVYVINRDGTAWVQMDQTGNIDIFGATNISMRAQRDFNIRADRNINIEAGQNVFIKAAKDTVTSTTSFTYDVNNIPKPATIPYYKYVGEGNGQGGDIVMQALNNWQSTTKNTAYLTVTQNNMNVKVANALSVTTVSGGQEYNSKQGLKLTTDAALDIAATGNVRIGTKGQMSVVAQGNLILCTDADLNLKAANNIRAAAGSSILNESANFGIKAPTVIEGPVALGVPAPSANPASAEGALSAGTAKSAEIKPLNDKINILATWKDPISKFKRNAEGLKTTVSKFPTYEPCPEHESFSTVSISGYTPPQTEGSRTYKGSGGAGNSNAAVPPPDTTPGAKNTSVKGDPITDSALAKDINMVAYRRQLEYHEGVKYMSYQDRSGISAGIGHLLRSDEIPLYPISTPVSREQVEIWFQQDAPTSIGIAQRLLGVDIWANLSDVRKRAVADLAYNLGEGGLSGFTKFLAAMRAEKYDIAGAELRNSKWFTQVGRRGPNIITMIVNNADPIGSA